MGCTSSNEIEESGDYWISGCHYSNTNEEGYFYLGLKKEYKNSFETPPIVGCSIYEIQNEKYNLIKSFGKTTKDCNKHIAFTRAKLYNGNRFYSGMLVLHSLSVRDYTGIPIINGVNITHKTMQGKVTEARAGNSWGAKTENIFQFDVGSYNHQVLNAGYSTITFSFNEMQFMTENACICTNSLISFTLKDSPSIHTWASYVEGLNKNGIERGDNNLPLQEWLSNVLDNSLHNLQNLDL